MADPNTPAIELRGLRKRLSEKANVNHEGNNYAELNFFIHYERRADNAYGNIAEVADEVHQRHHNARDKLGFPRASVKLVVNFGEGLRGLFLAVVGAHNIKSRVDFFDVPVYSAELALLVFEMYLGFAHD